MMNDESWITSCLIQFIIPFKAMLSSILKNFLKFIVIFIQILQLEQKNSQLFNKKLVKLKLYV